MTDRHQTPTTEDRHENPDDGRGGEPPQPVLRATRERRAGYDGTFASITGVSPDGSERRNLELQAWDDWPDERAISIEVGPKRKPHVAFVKADDLAGFAGGDTASQEFPGLSTRKKSRPVRMLTAKGTTTIRMRMKDTIVEVSVSERDLRAAVETLAGPHAAKPEVL